MYETPRYYSPYCDRVYFFPAAAMSTPFPGLALVPGDTTQVSAKVSTGPAKDKKRSFFTKLKNTLVSFVTKNGVDGKSKPDKRTTLGLVSMGAILLGLGFCLPVAPAFLYCLYWGVLSPV